MKRQNHQFMKFISLLKFQDYSTQKHFAAARLPFTHCHTACRNVGMPSAMLGDDGQKTQLYAGPDKRCENNGAKMTSRLRKKFLVRNKTSQNHISQLKSVLY